MFEPGVKTAYLSYPMQHAEGDRRGAGRVQAAPRRAAAGVRPGRRQRLRESRRPAAIPSAAGRDGPGAADATVCAPTGRPSCRAAPWPARTAGRAARGCRRDGAVRRARPAPHRGSDRLPRLQADRPIRHRGGLLRRAGALAGRHQRDELRAANRQARLRRLAAHRARRRRSSPATARASSPPPTSCSATSTATASPDILTPAPPLRRGEGERKIVCSPSPRRRGGRGVRSYLPDIPPVGSSLSMTRPSEPTQAANTV